MMADHSNEELARAIGGQRGWLSFSARRLGISRDEIRRRAAASKEVALAIREAEELRDDIAEQQLFKAVEDGASWAITLYLRLREARRAAQPPAEDGSIKVREHEDFFESHANNRAAKTVAPSDSNSGEPGAV
jgi:hypothetical protein